MRRRLGWEDDRRKCGCRCGTGRPCVMMVVAKMGLGLKMEGEGLLVRSEWGSAAAEKTV